MSEETTTNVFEKTCGLCGTNSSKYSCPRCDVLYCSLDCYKSEKHSECSESFYKDRVHEELASYQNDDESRSKMIDILKKMHNEDIDVGDIEGLLENVEEIDSDDEDGIDLSERVRGLNLDDADALWNALTEDEKNEFEALLNQGDVGSIMPQWEPWWMYSRQKKLVEDLKESNEELEMLKACPALKTVPDITSLSKVQPSPAIRFNITNVLASYAFIMRYFNGEVDPLEGAVYLLKICNNLNNNTNYDDLAIAVESVAQNCLQFNEIQTDEASLNIMKRDTFLILQGPSEDNQKYYCKAALSHLHKILNGAKAAVKRPVERKDATGFSKKFPDHKTKDLPSLDISIVKKSIKKIEFYLSYVESCSMYFE